MVRRWTGWTLSSGGGEDECSEANIVRLIVNCGLLFRVLVGGVLLASCTTSGSDPKVEGEASSGDPATGGTTGQAPTPGMDASSGAEDDTSGSTSASTTAAPADDSTTTEGEDTSVECPDNPCSGSDAGPDGYCEDDTTRVECVMGPDGCPVPGQMSQCDDACAAGVCCSSSIAGDDPLCECISNECVDHGLGPGTHCLPDGRFLECGELSCLRPVNGTPTECEDGLACDASTGTCGGCDPENPCFGWSEGTSVCTGLNAATCAVVDGCMVETDAVQCQQACFFGQGCCGGAGDACCVALQPPCFNGLSCVDDVCT